MYNKFHNNGPIGERDYEDAGSVYTVSPVVKAREAKVASVAEQRFALIAKLTAELTTSKGRRPLRSEIDAINKQVNRTFGL